MLYTRLGVLSQSYNAIGEFIGARVLAASGVSYEWWPCKVMGYRWAGVWMGERGDVVSAGGWCMHTGSAKLSLGQRRGETPGALRFQGAFKRLTATTQEWTLCLTAMRRATSGVVYLRHRILSHFGPSAHLAAQSRLSVTFFSYLHALLCSSTTTPISTLHSSSFKRTFARHGYRQETL
jgi:hypothetical protein